MQLESKYVKNQIPTEASVGYSWNVHDVQHPCAKIESSPILDTSCMADLIYDLIDKNFYAGRVPNRWRFDFCNSCSGGFWKVN